MSDAGITEDLTRSVEEITLGFIDDITPPAIAFALGEAVPAVTAKLADYMTKHDLKFIPADETIALIARQTPRPARTFLRLYYMFSRFVAVRALNGQPIHEDIPFEKGVSNGNDRLYGSGMYAKYGEVKVVFDSSGDTFTLTAEDLNIFAAGYRYQQERNRQYITLADRGIRKQNWRRNCLRNVSGTNLPHENSSTGMKTGTLISAG